MPEKPFEAGDVVWSPNQGTGYIACALTSNTRPDENAIPLAPKDWAKGTAQAPPA